MAEQEKEDDGSGANPKQMSSVSSKKKPPPESLESTRIRSFVISSFWAVVILLGLPVWIWTTSIYRARLPLQDMLDWADGKACKPTFPLQISIEAPSLSDAEATHLTQITQHALDDLNEFSAHHLRLQWARSSTQTRKNVSMPMTEGSTSYDTIWQYDDEVEFGGRALTVRLYPQNGVQTPRAALQHHSTTLDVFFNPTQIPSVSSTSSPLATFIAKELQDLYSEEQITIAYVLSQSFVNAHPSASQSHSSQSMSSLPRDTRSRLNRSLKPELAAQLASRMTRTLKYAPTYHITISLFTPSASPSSWEIDAALAEYFTPLLNSISIVSNFTIDTQIQLYASFSPSVHAPEYDIEEGVWTLKDEDLSGFINAAEWPLSPSIGAGPTLNFVLYVPDRANSPLVVKKSHATSWLIPQWGGVVILNPADANETLVKQKLPRESIQPAMLTFSHQLLSFLGAPHTPPSLPLQLQTLTRIRAASLLLSASSTMGSLARLTVALPSIAIPETVSSAVDTTLLNLRSTCNALKEGRFSDALNDARIAEAEAEKGFFEKSMVGQVYFPDEHKVAVYLPLLGPIGVPLIMSAIKEAKRLYATQKGNKAGT